MPGLLEKIFDVHDLDKYRRLSMASGLISKRVVLNDDHASDARKSVQNFLICIKKYNKQNKKRNNILPLEQHMCWVRLLTFWTCASTVYHSCSQYLIAIKRNDYQNA